MSHSRVFFYLNQAHNLREAYIHAEKKRLDESLNRRNLNFLLEQDDKKKASKFYATVGQAADEAEGEVNALAAKLPPQMANTKAALERAKGEITTNRLKQGSLSDMVGAPYRDLAKILSNAQGLSSSIGSAFQTVVSSLSGLGDQLTDDEERKKDLGTILATYAGTEGSKLPTQQDFEAAIKNALKPAKGITGGIGQGLKGFLGKISSLWGGGGGADVGFGLSKEDFISDMMDMSAVDLDKFLKGSASALKDVTTAGGNDPMQLASSALADADVEISETGEVEAEEEEAGEPEKVEADTTLRDILVGMGVENDDASGLVGDLKDLTVDELKGSLPDEPEGEDAKQKYGELSSALEDKISKFFEHRIHESRGFSEVIYDEDELIKYRWLKMAGIKNDTET